VIRQLLAIIEDDRVNHNLTKFVTDLLYDIYHSPIPDPLLEDEGLKLLLIYLRRLQNYGKDQDNPTSHPNPFFLNKNTFKLAEEIIQHLDFEEDEMLNIFLILEEIHFSLPQADINEIQEETV